MDGVRPVSFRFEDDVDVKYMAEIPVCGDLVTHGDGLWVVLHVQIDAIGTTVFCKRPTDSDGGLRRVA